MSDVDEIIDYIKSLKRGFDKDLFQSKIDELAHAVDTEGLDNEDFHTLLKVWLNLTIPITKWISVGVCLVPRNIVTEQTMNYILRWLLASVQDQANFARIAFLLDWLTAAMDCESIDIAALDCGYEVFFSLLSYEVLAIHVLKLVYTLTKPTDVTRSRVLELFDYAKKRESKKSMSRQLQVLLGLFKSYKPEYVPEDIPAVPVHTTFKSNIQLLSRFKKWQEQRNETVRDSHHLMWTNPMLGAKSKKVESLVPSIEFINIGSQQYQDKELQKNYLDFIDPVSLLQYSLHYRVSRPARLRALLRNQTGLLLIATMQAREQAALHTDLRHALAGCFLEASPHSEAERRDALHRLAALQRALCQPLRVVSAFLAYYLPLWDESRYFHEILELLEWVEADPELLSQIVEPITRVYHSAQPMEQCAILRALTTTYTNLVYACSRKRQHFVGEAPPRGAYAEALRFVAASVSGMCGRALQATPEDLRLLYSSTQSSLRSACAHLPPGGGGGGGGGGGAGRCVLPPPPSPPALALPLLSVSADLIDMISKLLLTYRKIIQSNKENRSDPRYSEHKEILMGYTSDVHNCLVLETSISSRHTGFVFQRIHPQVAWRLSECFPGTDAALSIRNHLALAPYTYVQMETIDPSVADNELWLDAVVNKEFTHLSALLAKL